MFMRAVIAFLVLPGVVAFVIPLTWVVQASLVLNYPTGLVLVAVGCIALLWCVRDFYIAGKGTLAPWAPPKKLVVIGLYRYSRNPMYVAVTIILTGWAVSFFSIILFSYAFIVMSAFHVRIILGEEPWLAKTHCGEWHRYTTRVRRWL